jgi:hypothetical protein
MKVQIVQLEAQDDLASISDKLAWAQASRLVLVWPDRSRVLRKRLDLVLLLRQAARRGIQLGLVTRDPVVLEHATDLGIPTFRSSTRLPEAGWQATREAAPPIPPRPTQRTVAERPAPAQPRALPAWLRLSLAAMVGLTLVAALALIVPSATIILSPGVRDQPTELLFTLDPQAESPTAAGHVPARQITLQLSGSTRVATTGQTQVADRPASGNVTFTNLTDASVLIPAGTGVLPSGRPDLRFDTTSDLSLAAGIGATETTGVVSASPGLAGNLPPKTLNAIDGPLGLKAAVSQPLSLTGGSEIGRPAVASADHATALRLLTEQLLGEAATAIAADNMTDEVLAPGSLRIVRTEVRVFDREIGAAADSVGLEMALEIAALVYQPKDLEAAASLALADRLPPGAEIVPQSIIVTLKAPDAARPDTLRAQVQQQLFTPVAEAQIRRMARGLRPEQAVAHLSSLSGQAAPPRIQTQPVWWPILPWLDVRIEVRPTWMPG